MQILLRIALFSFVSVYLAIEILCIILHWKREHLIKEIFGPCNSRRMTINLARGGVEYGATQPRNFASPLLVV
ncbi:MAG: hypothetical protein PWP57_62 [Candidatus Atribacteria bacterium]|nr:hypothetical protein [Candidatus Atribacteria bacterium]